MAVTEQFHAALEQDDGQAACDELSEETASKLEQEEGKPCEEAILELDLPKGGTVALRRVETRSAYADLAEGSADFLDEGAGGWKISAAGCRRDRGRAAVRLRAGGLRCERCWSSTSS